MQNFVQNLEFVLNKGITKRGFIKGLLKGAKYATLGYGLSKLLSCAAIQTDELTPSSKSLGKNKLSNSFLQSTYQGWTPGIDWKVPSKTPMVAIAPGFIVHYGEIQMIGHAGGYYVWVGHGTKGENYRGMETHYWSTYAHLNTVEVEIGDEVNRGQIIGYAGDSDTYNIAKLILKEMGNHVNPEEYGHNHGSMRTWDGTTNWIVEDKRSRLYIQDGITRELINTYQGEDSIINKASTTREFPIIRKGYYGVAKWSNLMMLKYLEKKITENPNDFKISLDEFLKQKKVFYDNQALVATMPFFK